MRALPIAVVLAAPLQAVAQKAVDLAAYDCTLPTENRTLSGAELAKQGYQILNRSRFGDVNVMMSKPNSSSLVNCFKRQGAR